MSELLQSITVRRLIKAERNRVFDAFSRAEALSQWFSPGADIGVELDVFEFVPQGKFRLCYTMADNSKTAVNGVYEVIKRPEQIIFTWMWEPPDQHADIPTRVFIYLEEKGENTEVALTHDKLPKEACGRHIKAWEVTLDRLEFALAGLPTTTGM